VAACANCSAELADGAAFCRKCGKPVLAPSCPSCGAPDENDLFCSRCGAALGSQAAAATSAQQQQSQPVAERRVTSVLFGDLVGFTPLSESKDSEEVRELLSAYFQHCRVIVGRYGGVIEKFIGDAVMAVWGVPVAHEDDAERAVRAGLELVAMVTALGGEVGAPGLAQRVGIVTGEVAVTVGATAEGMVAGDAVNTAARVQSAASPGRVWVDETTRGLASAAIMFDDVGEHALKGKAEPMRLFEAGVVVSSVGGAQRVDGLEAPFTGRDADLRLVKELFHATQDAGRPKLVVLDGEAGVGKSRLAWEFEKYVDGLTASTRWHRGRCLSYGDGVAFWALAEAMRARFGLVEADTGSVVAERLDAGMAEYVADAGERDWLRPRLAVLLGEAGAGQFAREDLFAAWTAFLEQLAVGESAVVLVLDDAQYADDGLLDFADHLLATARAPIFVLALSRPELLRRRPDLGGRRATVVRLEPLDDDAMATLIDGLVADLPTTARSVLVERADGIPLFAVETVRALIDRDLVIPREGRYVPADHTNLDLDAVGVPASLLALVAARLDALTREEKQVVSDAAVLGLTFTRVGLVALGSDTANLDSVLEELRRKEVFALQTDRFSAERGQYRFIQSVVRQVAYTTQSRRDRKIRHLAAANYLAGEPSPGDELAIVIAQHLLDAIDASAADETDSINLVRRAIDYLERAAARARSIGAPVEAHRLLASALAKTRTPADRARLSLEAARTSWDIGVYVRASEYATEAMEGYASLDEPVMVGVAAALRAKALFALNELSAALEVAEPHWRSLRDVVGAEPALLELADTLCELHEYRGAKDEVGVYADQTIRYAESLGDFKALARAYCRLAFRYDAIGARHTSIVMARNAAEIAQTHGLNYELATALKDMAATEVSSDLQAAIKHSRESLAAAARAGVGRAQDISTSNLSLALWTAGRLDEVRAVLDDYTVSSAGGTASLVTHCLAVMLAQAQGRPLPPARPSLSTENMQVSAWQRFIDTMYAGDEGDQSRVADDARSALDDTLAAGGLGDDFYFIWPQLTLLSLSVGSLDVAEGMLSVVTDARPELLPIGITAQWHRLRGLIAAARGETQLVESALRTGIESLGEYGALGHRAQVQEELARWLVDQERPGDAQPFIDAARTTYTDIAATGWLARLDAWDTSRHSTAAR